MSPFCVSYFFLVLLLYFFHNESSHMISFILLYSLFLDDTFQLIFDSKVINIVLQSMYFLLAYFECHLRTPVGGTSNCPFQICFISKVWETATFLNFLFIYFQTGEEVPSIVTPIIQLWGLDFWIRSRIDLGVGCLCGQDSTWISSCQGRSHCNWRQNSQCKLKLHFYGISGAYLKQTLNHFLITSLIGNLFVFSKCSKKEGN